MGYTKIDNCWLDIHNELTNAEFRVMMVLERLLTGFHRKSYVVPYSKISEMTGVKNVYNIMKSLKEKGLVSFKSETGRASEIQIHKPTKLVSRSSKKAYNSVSSTIEVNDIDHSNNLYDPPLAKEKFKENLKKDLFLEFKNKYPKEKIDDDVEATWNSLSYEHQKLVIGVMPYQLNMWSDPNFNHKYIPKSSNYLLKQLYLDDDIKKPYDDLIRRKKEAVERRKYIEEADQNSASDEEKKAILSNWKNQ